VLIKICHFFPGIGLSPSLVTFLRTIVITPHIFALCNATAFWLIVATICPAAMMMIIYEVGSGATFGKHSYLYL
jgi:hypothetical protein